MLVFQEKQIAAGAIQARTLYNMEATARKTQREKTAEDYIHMVVKDFAFLIVPVLLILPATMIMTKNVQELYRATASIAINFQGEYWKKQIVAGVIKDKQDAPLFDLNQTLEIASSRMMDKANYDKTIQRIDEVSSQLGFSKNQIRNVFESSFKKNQSKKEHIAKIKLNFGSSAPKKKKGKKKNNAQSKGFSINVEYPIQELSIKTANVLAEVIKIYFNEAEDDKKNKRFEYLSRQTAYYKKKYDVSRSVLEKFEESTRQVFSAKRQSRVKELLGFDPDVRVDEISYDKFKGDFIDLNLNLKSLIATKENIEKELEETSQYIVSEISDVASTEMQLMNARLSQLQLQLARLKIDSSPAHPLVIQTEEEIANITDLIAELDEGANVTTVKKLNPQYESLQNRLAEVKEKITSAETKIELTKLTIDDMQEKLEAENQMKSQVAKLKKDVEEAQSIYENFETRLRNEQIKASIEGEDLSYVAEIFPATNAKNLLVKKRADTFMRNLMFGVLIGAGIIYLRNMRDTSYRTAIDLRKDLRIPVFGSTTFMVTQEEIDSKAMWNKRFFIGYGIYLVVIIIAGVI